MRPVDTARGARLPAASLSARGLAYVQALLPVAVLALVVVVLVGEPAAVSALRNAVFDSYQRLRPRTYTPVPVRIVDIDDESLARVGQWPWPRTRMAALVETLKSLGAAAVGLDMVFAEPDRTSPRRLVEQFGDDPVLDAWAAGKPDHDAALADAVAEANVVTGFALIPEANDDQPPVKAAFAVAGGDLRPHLAAFAGAVANLPILSASAAGNGALNVIPDGDGVIRRVPLLLRLDDRILPSLTAEILRVAQGADTYVIKTAGASGERSFGADTGVTGVRVGALPIPTDARSQVWLYLTGPVRDRTVSAWRVLSGEVDARDLAQSLVIVGASAIGLQDRHASPLGINVPGHRLHAEILEQSLTGVHLIRPDWVLGAEVLFAVILGLFVIVIGRRIGALWTAAVGGIAIAAAFAGSWWAFVHSRMLLDPLLPSLAAGSVYVLASLLSHLRKEREQRWIRQAFSRYVSPALVEELIAHPEQLRLGGERRVITIMQTDLAGYTPLIEKMPPETIIPVLNTYLDGMIRIVFTHGGTVNKVIGDAMFVLFGAPVVQGDHATRAVACALALDAFAEDFAAGRWAEGIAFGHTRIGVNTGCVVVGNFGGLLQFDYTANGDAVNVAARLETANKHLGTRLCVSAATAKACIGFTGRPVGELILKGKSECIMAFEPLAPTDMTAPRVADYVKACGLLESGDGDPATAFDKLAKAYPADALIAFHRDRLAAGDIGTSVVLSEK